MTRKTERDLDKMLTGTGKPGDEDETSIAQLAKEIEAAFTVEPPPARRERSMFVHALAGRNASHMPSLRFAVPATALMLLLALTAFFGRTATGGDLLFPVRKVMAEAGLATNPQEEIERNIERAEDFIDQAEDAATVAQAEELVITRAGGRLGDARVLADELGPDERTDALEEIRDVQTEGGEVLAEVREEMREESGGDEGSGSDDSSGSGSGDDSSGSGSGDDDSSGSGSGDDSSGSGSDDDSSGSGSGDDSSGSGSGSGDSSGSGSGDDSSGSG